MLAMKAVNAGSRNSIATFGMVRTVAIKSFLSVFMEALRQSRRREARRIIATYAHLLDDRKTLDNDDQH